MSDGDNDENILGESQYISESSTETSVSKDENIMEKIKKMTVMITL